MSKALATEADEIVLDLEDAVAPSAKSTARSVATDVVRDNPGRQLAIRVNQIGTPWCHGDVLEVVAAAPEASLTVVVPKVDSPEDVGFIDRLVRGAAAEACIAPSTIRIDVLVESAAGLNLLPQILAASDLVRAVVVGYADLGADLGRGRGDDPTLWDAVRHQVVVAARATGTAVLDGPWLSTTTDSPFVSDRERARALGFDGTWVIHPRQIEEATRIYTPSAEAVVWAGRVVAELDAAVRRGVGAVALDGQMIDEAVAIRARSILARHHGRPDHASS